MTEIAGPHRRLNPLTGDWVLVSPHRMLRPWQGRVESVVAEWRPHYEPDCYLCPGNLRAGGLRNPAYAGTFVFENDFPALHPDGEAFEVSVGDLLVARAEQGICRVICFSPRHDLSLAKMDVTGIRGVVDVWAEEYERLGHRDDIAHVQIFENKGEVMAAATPTRTGKFGPALGAAGAGDRPPGGPLRAPRVEMMRELADLRGRQPLTPAELEFARDFNLERLPLRLDGLPSLAGAVQRILRDSLPLDYYAQLVPSYNRVTLTQAIEAARKYVDPAHLAIVVVGDRSQVEAKLRALKLAPVVIVPPLADEDATPDPPPQ